MTCSLNRGGHSGHLPNMVSLGLMISEPQLPLLEKKKTKRIPAKAIGFQDYMLGTLIIQAN